jgi:hypothetical protein
MSHYGNLLKRSIHMEYFNYDSKLPIEEKKLVVSGKKISQSLLEKIAMDVRRNKPKDKTESA